MKRIVIVGSLLFSVLFILLYSDIFISAETKVKRVMSNYDRLPLHQQDTINAFYTDNRQLVDGEEHVNQVKLSYADGTFIAALNADHAVYVTATALAHGGPWGYGFLLFTLNKSHFLSKWEIEAIYYLPIEEDRTGFKWPEDFLEDK